MRLLDAHNHLHDQRLEAQRAPVLAALAQAGVARAVVNGTREEDWQAVATLASSEPWVLPSFGLHPWHAPTRSARWQERLLEHLEAHPRAGVGEIGLDRWIAGHDLEDQCSVLRAQLAIAARLKRPATIHCIQAWGALLETLEASALPACGFLLHAYGGPADMVGRFAALGARFSFPAYFLHPRKERQRLVFAAIPEERLLVETDAPDLAPPDSLNPHPLQDPAGNPINHPANLTLAYAGLAQVRRCEPGRLAEIIAANFERLFGS